jgi:hypothetical protein
MSAVDSQGRPGGAFAGIAGAIAAEGYALTWRVGNAADLGAIRPARLITRRAARYAGQPAPRHASSNCCCVLSCIVDGLVEPGLGDRVDPSSMVTLDGAWACVDRVARLFGCASSSAELML